MNEKELMEKLAPYICAHCSNFKSEHSSGARFCPKSGRTKRFKPGGYTPIPTELLLLIFKKN